MAGFRPPAAGTVAAGAASWRSAASALAAGATSPRSTSACAAAASTTAGAAGGGVSTATASGCTASTSTVFGAASTARCRTPGVDASAEANGCAGLLVPGFDRAAAGFAAARARGAGFLASGPVVATGFRLAVARLDVLFEDGPAGTSLAGATSGGTGAATADSSGVGVAVTGAAVTESTLAVAFRRAAGGTGTALSESEGSAAERVGLTSGFDDWRFFCGIYLQV